MFKGVFTLFELSSCSSPRLYNSSTDKVSVEVYETQNFWSVFHPICDCMFGLLLITTLNIYKDYFKGYKRLRTITQEQISQE